MKPKGIFTLNLSEGQITLLVISDESIDFKSHHVGLWSVDGHEHRTFEFTVLALEVVLNSLVNLRPHPKTLPVLVIKLITNFLRSITTHFHVNPLSPSSTVKNKLQKS